MTETDASILSTVTMSYVTMTSNMSDVTDNTTSPAASGNDSAAAVAPEGCLVIPFSQNPPWMHPEDPISHETQQSFNQFVNVYMVTFLCLISTPTNIINMVVFFKLGLKERINLCLFFLAISDFFVVFMHFEWNLDGLIALLTDTPYKLVVMKWNVNNSVHAMAGFIYVSAFLSTVIALERCLCVVSPLRAQSMFSAKTAGVIIFVGHVIILGTHYIIAARWEVVCMYDPIIKATVDAFYSSEFYVENEALVNFFDGIVFGILFPGICLAGITVATVVTVANIKKLTAWREQSSSAASTAARDVTLTRMLIGVSVLFIVCNTPGFIFHTAIPFVSGLSLSGRYYNTYYFLINVQQLFIYVNSSVNFFVYYFYGTKFRNTVQRLCCGRSPEKGKTSMAQLSTIVSNADTVTTVTQK